MNNEQQQIVDEVYENYLSKAKNYTTEDLFYNKLSGAGDIIEGMLSAHTRDFIPYSQEEFINKCKTNPEFSERWGLKIEERELSRKERSEYYYKHGNSEGIVEGSLDRPIWEEDDVAHKWYDDKNIPVRLITITYNDKTIESYE